MDSKKEHNVYFDGTGDITSSVEKVELIAQLKGHTEEKKAQFIGSKLGGTAFDAYRRLSVDEKKDPEAIKTNLLKEICREQRNREEALSALMKGCRLSGESPQIYAYRILKLVGLAYVTLGADIQNTIARDYFMKGLSNELQVAIIPVTGFSGMTLNQLSDETTRLEIAGVNAGNQIKIASVETSESGLVERITAGVIEKLKSTNLMDVACGINEEVNAVGNDFRGRGSSNFRGRYRGRSDNRREYQANQSGRRCRVCQSSSHLFRNCPVRHC